MQTADGIMPTQTDRGLPAALFLKFQHGRDYQMVAAGLNKQGQVQFTTLKKSSLKEKPESPA